MKENLYKILGQTKSGQYGWLCNVWAVDADAALSKARRVYGHNATGVQRFDASYDDVANMIDPDMKG